MIHRRARLDPPGVFPVTSQDSPAKRRHFFASLRRCGIRRLALRLLLLLLVASCSYFYGNLANKLLGRDALIESGDGIFVISLQGTLGADKRNEGRLDAFSQAWERSCGSPPKIHHCPGVMDARRGYGLTRSWLQCLEMARPMDLDVTIIFEDDARLFERDSSLSFCNAAARKTEFWSRLPDDTFLVFLGGHTWKYADGGGESGEGSSGQGGYRETSSSYGTYGFALPRKSFDEILGTIRHDIDHGFVDEKGVIHTNFLSPERSWYLKAKVLGKKIYAASPLTVWHEGGFSNTWKNNRGSITGEETGADQRIRGMSKPKQ